MRLSLRRSEAEALARLEADAASEDLRRVGEKARVLLGGGVEPIPGQLDLEEAIRDAA